ncbi:hypothetical protein N7491_006931 [Penicillium cf. griseofulvum]|nr:hypothetical protein N7491_006931 [Penicillium cf. griseofulvum]
MEPDSTRSAALANPASGIVILPEAGLATGSLGTQLRTVFHRSQTRYPVVSVPRGRIRITVISDGYTVSEIHLCSLTLLVKL